ncbi:MAG: hypothetical protein A3H96_26785 [Acidobacteria bacterium RIFCSPLOWO2_02_FULL_67_36]|nr:MAG: hypothetical protein A3H96_26785 [Acidobacteria bacterium RIFCSPLOWO2_02_FULL_67_36]OFW24857.1 MAG: hypothetical protein A3G21_12580 [Acidobacteria bacterium RIFCSPLOWO2_12_FULL_66_21]
MDGRYSGLLLRTLSGLFIALTVGAGGGVAWFLLRYPRVASPNPVLIHVTAALIERGRYLANHVAVCMDCHSTRDWDAFSGPIVPGTEGAGGQRFGKELGLPGTFYAANITPAGLSQWSDGEILRAITGGVTRRGRAMFPVMPYPRYRALSETDAEAIVAYIRTLTPVAREIRPSQLDFPMNVLVRTLPEPFVPRPPPDRSSPVAYGRYLTTIAGCSACHTRSERGKPIQGMEYAGGAAFDVPRAGRVQSANITPDSDTGIGDWPRAFFVARFRDPTSAGTRRLLPRDRRLNTIMPWTMFAGMTDEDLGAIYAYLRTVRPVRNQVARFSGAS